MSAYISFIFFRKTFRHIKQPQSGAFFTVPHPDGMTAMPMSLSSLKFVAVIRNLKALEDAASLREIADARIHAG
ncbi:hypothetical protein F2P47_14790 [Parvibaculum sedimenti]|uniref:Uncharacterized protein n=1 Tax=Parvibaculum sedimenti TaxID=2608632 RepID=A0A6N6VF92_9HYPH|nr:hypothetical protein F2P47_14790 [Parvibaculum sedimenti]